MNSGLEHTIDLRPADQNSKLAETQLHAESLGVSRVQIESQGHSDDRLKNLFEESTRQLLRDRLAIAAAILASMMSIAQIFIWFSRLQSLDTTIVRLSAIAGLVGVLILLKRRPTLKLQPLRWIELLVVFVPILEVVYVQFEEVPRLIEVGSAYQVPGLTGSLGAVICFFVATYAMFIPSNWKRTAVVGFIAAVLPTALTATHIQR